MKWERLKKGLFLIMLGVAMNFAILIKEGTTAKEKKENYVSNFYLFMKGIEDASRYYGVPQNLLYAIAYVESGFNFRAVNVNKNKTKDYGVFQINERNLKRFGYSKEVAMHPYWSAYLAAYILKECINKVGYSWKAVDCYNKGAEKAKNNSKYVWKVYTMMQKLKFYAFIPDEKSKIR